MYSGNIAAMVTDIPKAGGKMLHTYRYDQLNRIKEVNNFTAYNPATNTWAATEANKERLTFDANGNIKTALLNGDISQPAYENFTYTYDAVKKNRLLSISNSVNNATYNYQYDEIGNATKDELEGNQQIGWTVYGKIKNIVKTDGTQIDYTYDAAGNRISKKVVSSGITKWTYYVRDAAGNTMATYIKEPQVNGNKLTQEACNMYSSNMAGRWKLMRDVETIPPPNNGQQLQRGWQEFYFGNHLGNNLVVLSDKKLQHSSNGQVVDWYDADVISATDYSAYGENLKGREFSGSLIKYGFNGKENDADAGYQDYGMRVYSVKARRFPSVDPITDEYPELTPYQFASNTPILAIDLDGLEAAVQMPDGTIYWPRGWDNLAPKYPQGGKLIGITPAPKIDGKQMLSMALDFIPGVGNAKGLIEGLIGQDLITGEKLSDAERALALLPYAGKLAKGTKAATTTIVVVKAEDKAAEVKKAVKTATKAEDAAVTSEKAIVEDGASVVSEVKKPSTNPNQLGKEGEVATGAGKPGQRERYVGASGNNRISDKSTKTTLQETKNVKRQGLTSQIKDGITHAKNTQRKYILWTRKSTKITKPLTEKIKNGEVIRKNIPGSN